MRHYTYTCSTGADVYVEIDNEELIEYLERNGYEVIDREENPEESTKGIFCQPYVSRLNMIMNMSFEQGCKDTLREFLTSQLNLPFDSDKETICKHLKDRL